MNKKNVDRNLANLEIVKYILEQEAIYEEKYGWYVHHVIDEEDNSINCHTHNFEKSFGHLDLQIVLECSTKEHKQILNNILYLIIGDAEYKGVPIIPNRIIKSGDIIYNGIIKDGYPVLFKEGLDMGRKVLRVLICDENKKLPGEEGCSALYNKQLDYDTSEY